MRLGTGTARLCLSLVACCGLLAGCGQRGALYLPEESRDVVVTPAQPAAAPAPAVAPAATPEPTEEQRRNNATAPAK